MSGRVLVSLALLAALAGCGGAPDQVATPEPTSEDLPEPSTTTSPPPPPPIRRIVQSGAANVTKAPTFTMPDQQPGILWERVELSAQMPAGTWLFVYVPLPPGMELASEEMPRQFRISGHTNGTNTGHIAFAPFLVQDDNDGIIPETYFAEARAVHPQAPGAWSWEPEVAEIVPFGGTHYAGIAAFAAATSDWRLELAIEAPWKGNGTIGPDNVTWGPGFAIQRLPAMTPPETAGSEARLDWSQAYTEGWLAVQAASTCYNPSPCADAVTQEDWTFTLPQASLEREFHRTASSGTSPCCLFGVMDSPAGTMSVQGTLSGLTGARDVDVFFAPVPHDAWPFALDDTKFEWP